MGLYRKYILPRVIDMACSQRHISGPRGALVSRAHGDVLEIGFGTGLNLPVYNPARVRRLWALDPAWDEMRGLAFARLAQSDIRIHPMRESAECISAEDHFFDSVVMTYSLCSIPRPAAALEEIRRVMKPGATLLFAEHGLAPEPGVRRLQGLLNPIWGCLGGGCRLDRPMDDLILAAGFSMQELEKNYLPGLRFASYVYRGVAVRE